MSAVNQTTNVEYAGVSNEAGNYTITSLPVGTYVVKSALGGFKTVTTKALALEAKQIARLDFRMEIGQVEDMVEVTAAAPVLQTESATVGEVISGDAVQSLPLNGRNVGQLALLLPGTVTYNPRGFTNIGSVNMNRPFVNGNREQTNNFTVDGLDVNETIDNRVAYQPIPDAVAEIAVETNNYAADVGNVGGALISNVVKSGGNEFRGNLFEFYRNSDLDANAWRTTAPPRPARSATAHLRRHARRPHHQGQAVLLRRLPGLAAGRARLGHGQRRAGVLAQRRSVQHHHRHPRPGHGTALPQQPDPARPLQPHRAPDPERPRELPAAQPQRDRRGRQLRGRRAVQGPRPPGRPAPGLERVRERQVLRALLVRDLRGPAGRERVSARLRPPQRQPFYNVGVNWSRVLGPSVITRSPPGTATRRRLPDRRLVGDRRRQRPVWNRRPAHRRAQLHHQRRRGLHRLNGLTPLGSIATDSDTVAKTYQLNEKLTWLTGRHNFKFGGQILHYDQQRFYAGNNGLLGYLSYTGAFTGSAFADFLLDQVSGKGGGRRPRGPVDALAEPRRALRAGRHHAAVELHAERGAALGLHVAPGRKGRPAEQLRPRDRPADPGQRRRPRAVRALLQGLRAPPGLRVAHQRPHRRARRVRHLAVHGGDGRQPAAAPEPPFFYESALAFDRTTGAGSGSTGFAGLVPGTTPSGNVRAYAADLRPQFTRRWNAFVEYRVTDGMSAQLGYVGHDATHLVTPTEGNQALPGVGDPATWAPKNARRPLFDELPLVTTIATTTSRSGSKYNSLQASIRQRQWKGLEFLASYTFARHPNNRGFYGVFSGTQPQGVVSATEALTRRTPTTPRRSRPQCPRRGHNFVFSSTYDLPRRKRRSG